MTYILLHRLILSLCFLAGFFERLADVSPPLAFILYRQHRQAQVVAQNPGLANPEISKIIGDEWRAEPEERKNQWKRLAEEEKQRHARQYPDYRYQPRRGNKGVPPRLTTATGEDPGRCPKCGGRYIATPRTPLPPFVSPPASGNSKPWATGQGGSGSQGHPHNHAHTPRPDMGDAHHYRHGSQSSSHGHAEMSARGRGPWHGSSHASHPGLQGINEDYEPMSASPSEAKRRRYNPSGNGYHGYPALPSPPGSYGGGYPHPQRQKYPSISGPSPGPLPGPSMISHASHPAITGPPHTPMIAAPLHGHSHGHMGPPPRPNSVSTPLGPGASQFDESLRLPPLQTQLPTSPDSDKSMAAYSAAAAVPQSHLPPSQAPPAGGWYQTPDPHPQQNAPPYAHSLHAPAPDRMLNFEENFMSIPYYNKLMFLEYIQPRLPPPTPSVSRGPIIAIEGNDSRLLRMVGPVVEHALLASRECDVRMWLPTGSSPGQGLGQAEGDAPLVVSGNLDDTPMTDFVRTQAQRSAATSRSGSVSGSASANSRAGTDSNAAAHPFVAIFHDMMEWHVKSGELVRFITGSGARGSPTGIAPRLSDASSSSAEQAVFHSRTASPASQGHGAGQTQARQKPRLPIALLPEGYSLTLSDRAACACAHVRNVHFKPVDHWQWIGALWRDIAGPDLVVHVQAAGAEDDSPLGTQGGGSVEVRAPGLMLVRVGEREAREGLSEKTERRLGFEVVEWVRGGVFWAAWGNS